MSKVDAQRAMREARYAALEAQAAGSARVRPRAARNATVSAVPPAAALVEPPDAPAEALCGHRGGSGKPCTRPAKHAEKSHRYA